jgi:hypothetical protein
MVDSPENLRRQARALAAKGNGANEAWSDLRSWASGKGPLAMKSAMIEFVSLHGRSPEAALLMPQLLNDRSLSEPERKEILGLAKRLPSLRSGTSERLAPVFSAPLPRPTPTHNSREPHQAFTLPLSRDPSAMRDVHLVIRERARLSLERPSLQSLETPRFDASKSPDTFVMGAGMHKGEHLVRSLVDKLRGHARDEHPVQVISGEPKQGSKAKPKAKTTKRKPSKKPAKKAMRPKKKQRRK